MSELLQEQTRRPLPELLKERHRRPAPTPPRRIRMPLAPDPEGAAHYAALEAAIAPRPRRRTA